MERIMDLARARRSVRSFDGTAPNAEEKEKLLAFAAAIENPWGLGVEFRLLDAAEHGLSSPVITGARCYIGAKIAAAPHMEEAFGFSFETRPGSAGRWTARSSDARWSSARASACPASVRWAARRRR